MSPQWCECQWWDTGKMLGKSWEIVGIVTRMAFLFFALRSGSDCSEIDHVDGSRKADKAISGDSGRIAHIVTKTALNRFWKLLLLWWWPCTNSSWPGLKKIKLTTSQKIHVDQDLKILPSRLTLTTPLKRFDNNKINACIIVWVVVMYSQENKWPPDEHQSLGTEVQART